MKVGSVEGNNGYQRLKITIRGAVQGVGFRPFIYRLATDMGLPGSVNNSAQGVFIEVEGDHSQLTAFLGRIHQEKPPRSVIQSIDSSFDVPLGYVDFEIKHSESGGSKTTYVLPDIATCPDCLDEVRNPHNRRYRYPFTNCTNCGPRYTIIKALPYDRPHTTMRNFPMCAECRTEYENPLDRRFHAQPNACPVCGPHLELWDQAGTILATHDDALLATADAIRQGKIVAIKGLGGFHLMVDARNQGAVMELRQRKRREAKPFALMFSTLMMIEAYCYISELEAVLLTSAEAPIVLVERCATTDIVPEVAPDNPSLAVMLPYTPLHHLLMAELDFPIVATSGNLTDEPICTDEHEALERLGNIADMLLIHNRPIARHVDDSVVRVMAGREMMLRRARGYAPLPIQVAEELPPVLSVGAHLKNNIAASIGREVFISQHIGDLETAQAYDAFRAVIESFKALYEFQPEVVACDLHPDYLSTQYATALNLPVVTVQHHYAHVLACMAEHQIDTPVLGVSWDGTGYGTNGTIWGGEFLHITPSGFERVAHFKPFRLPGGDQAIKEPRRSALGLLYEIFGDAAFEMDDLPPIQAFSVGERTILARMLQRGINTPYTSSVGRLFDAVAALAGIRQRASFEGQAAIELEFALDEMAGYYEFEVGRDGVIAWDVQAMLTDIRRDISVATRFHNMLVEIILAIARRIGQQQVILTGGCFQNRYLTEKAVQRLRKAGFIPHFHQHIPPNDGGIALGQIMAVLRKEK